LTAKVAKEIAKDAKKGWVCGGLRLQSSFSIL
jgi:hypothetical protein